MSNGGKGGKSNDKIKSLLVYVASILHTADMSHASHLRLAANVGQSLNDLNQHYKDLTNLQANVATESKADEVQRRAADHHVLRLVHCVAYRVPGRLKKQALQIFIQCTKTDLSLNNWVTRAKCLTCKHL